MIAGQYGLTKLMLVGMTRILARILIQEEVRVNCVCPGLIKTDFSKYMWEK
jgi:dehydrogenase/reductase SDR family member 4